MCDCISMPTGAVIGMDAHIIDRNIPRAKSRALAALNIASAKRFRRRVLVMQLKIYIYICIHEYVSRLV